MKPNTPCLAWNNNTPNELHTVIYRSENEAYSSFGNTKGLAFDNFCEIPKYEYNHTILRMIERVNKNNIV